MSDVAPVQEQSRIKSLDVIRGFALLGILAVNALLFAGPWQTMQNALLPPLDVTEQTLWSWLVMHVFFEFKCITLFSMLFGVSIYLVGGDGSDRARGSLLRRRLFWLLVFGLLHGLLIWYGDILLMYALTGFVVMLVRSWRALTLMIAGGLLLLLSIGLQGMLGAFWDYIPPEQLGPLQQELEAVFAPSGEEIARVQAAYQGGLLSALRENVDSWVMLVTSSFVGLIIRTAAVMMIGMALFKWGFLSGKAPVWLYVLSIAVAGAALYVIWRQAMVNWDARFDTVHMLTGGIMTNVALSIFVSLGYASALILLVKAGAGLITGPLAAVGRMAFTNYIAQSLIMTTIFWSGRGFGLFGEIDRVALWGIIVAVWVLQLIWSPLWLAKFQMGPLEWLWRRLSYGKPIAIGKAEPA